MNLCFWVNNSMATITHSFQGKATSSPSQFPWTSLSWLIKLGLLTALSISGDSLRLPFIFNILLAFLKAITSFVLGWLTSLLDYKAKSIFSGTLRVSGIVKQQGKFSIFLKRTGTRRFINAKPSAFSMTILKTLGRGDMCIYCHCQTCQQAVARQAGV